MRIVYVGKAGGTSLHRARALQRLGHEVHVIDPWSWLKQSGILGKISRRLGYLGTSQSIYMRLKLEIGFHRPDLIWVNQGEFLDANTVQMLTRFGVPVINYANDNPFSAENRIRFRNYKSALHCYDIVVVVFEEAIVPARLLGAKKVIRTYQSADEIAHLGLQKPPGLEQEMLYEVTFIGTCFRKHRAPFLAELASYGVPLSIWGDNWKKSCHWKTLARYWRGPGVYDDLRYAELLQSSKVCLGLVNKSSGNLHTDRSIQIPALGSVLCAVKTTEHMSMYKDGVEAVFWDNAEDCAAKCFELLNNPDLRHSIASRGQERCRKNRLFNEEILKSILEKL